jgi:hypothetical protein
MPRVKDDTKKKSRSHDEGLWLVTAEGGWFEVKPSKIDAAKIVEEIAIRYGKPSVDGKHIELVESATFPVFRDDAVNLVKTEFSNLGFTPDKLFGKDPVAETKFNNFLTAVLKVASEKPLATYKRDFVDKSLNKVDSYEKYYVANVTAAGVEQLQKLPYYEKTHQIFEKDESGKLWILPSLYWDMWLPESYYELEPRTDEDRFGLAKLVEKLEDYPIPRPDGKGVVKQEAMLYREGYIAQSGASSGYYAFIRGKKVEDKDGSKKFTLEMKLSKSAFKYQHLVAFPKEGEVAATVGPQKPIMQMGVAELLAGIAK